MKLYYVLIVKGDQEEAAATLDLKRADLPEFETQELIDYGYCQTQAMVAFELDVAILDYSAVEARHSTERAEFAVAQLEGALNTWFTEDTEAPYPLGSLLFWQPYPGLSNTRESAEARGIKVFDTALPQPWCDQTRKILGDAHLWLSGNIVWSYDEARIWGEPKAVTRMGDEIMVRVNAA
jgi:hypothetical protein